MNTRAYGVTIQAAIATLLMAPALLHLGAALPGRPGMADLPGTVNFHWLVQEYGLQEAGRSSMLMFPAKLDRILLDGIPLDAICSWPFTSVFGWPAGFTLYVWTALFGLGLATAWLAQIWWKKPYLGWVAGGVAQTHPFLIRELADGRSTQIFAAIFVPVCLGFALRAINRDCVRSALLAGLFWGLGTLAYWFNGAFIGLGLMGLMLLSRPKRAWIPACGIGSLALTVAWPIQRILRSTAEMPGKGLSWSETVTHGDHPLPLWQLIEFRDLGATIVSERVLAAQGLLLICCIYGMIKLPRERWLLPLVWLGTALIFAAGPQLGVGDLSVPGPFSLFETTEWTRRLWWPDRALILAVPATALLVAGGVDQLRMRLKLNMSVLGMLLIGEAFWVIPGLPLGTTWGSTTEHTAQLKAGEGPALILPLGSGGTQPNARMLIDQIHHGRPLVNGPMPYTSSTAPTAYKNQIQSEALSGLVACETDPRNAAKASPWTALQSLGLAEVYLDGELAKRLPHGVMAYQECINQTLGQPEAQGSGLIVYRP